MISFLSIYEELKISSNLDDLFQRMMKLQGNYGISSGLYGVSYCKSTAQHDGITDSLFLKTNYSKDFLDHFGSEEFLDDDITAIHCLSKTTPLIWHEYDRYYDVNDNQRYYMEEGAYQFDMSVGVAIPVRFNEFGGGGMGLSAQGLGANEFIKIWSSYQHEITTITKIFDELTRTKFVDDEFKLNAREKDILNWLANGITIQEIAYKLNLGSSTIETQLRSARIKLGAKSNIQAITKAMVFNLIKP